MSLLLLAPDLLADTLAQAAALLAPLAEEAPEDEEVKAGWTAFAIFLGLAVAVGVLGWSLTKQLKKAQAAEDAGRYDPSDRPKRRTILPREGEEEQPGRDER